MSQEWQQTVITFCGATFPAPVELPLPQYGSRMKKHYMTDGDDAALCIREPLGVHVSYGTIAFRLSGLSKAQVVAMAAAHFDQATPRDLVFTSPDGTTTFEVLFGEGGFSPKMLPRSGYGDARRYAVDLKLEILTAVEAP
jgi:hypothetical protein